MNTAINFIIEHGTAAIAAPAVQEIVTKGLFELARLKLLLDAIETAQAAKIEAINKATAEELAPLRASYKALEASIKDMAENPANKAALFAKMRTFEAQMHAVSLRRTTSYNVGDEKETIALLEHARDHHEDPATRVLAAGCLRTETTLNRVFIKDNWKRFGTWFKAYFGIDQRIVDKASIKLCQEDAS